MGIASEPGGDRVTESLYLALLDCYEDSDDIWCHRMAKDTLRPTGNRYMYMYKCTCVCTCINVHVYVHVHVYTYTLNQLHVIHMVHTLYMYTCADTH